MNRFYLDACHMVSNFKQDRDETEYRTGCARRSCGNFRNHFPDVRRRTHDGPAENGYRRDAGKQAGRVMEVMMRILDGAVIFPLIYAYVLFGKLPGAPYVKGILWGFSIWLVAQLVVVPMMGAGVFGLKMNGIMSAFGSLMGHVIHGGLLGAIGGHGHAEGPERRTATA